MQWLQDFFNGFWDGLFRVGQWLANACLWIMFFWVKLLFKGFCAVVLAIIQGLDLGNMAVNSATAWAGLDPTVAWMITQSGIPTGLSMLGVAYGIRFMLNLIPAAFTRV